MKKGFIIGMLILLLATGVFAQAVPSSVTSVVDDILKNLIQINKKTCMKEPVTLTQQRFIGEGHFAMVSSSGQGTPIEDYFILNFPEKEGELVSIRDTKFSGRWETNSQPGDTCNVVIDGVTCASFVKTLPSSEQEYVYVSTSSTCTDSLIYDELKTMEITCPVLSGGRFHIERVLYHTSWKSC